MKNVKILFHFFATFAGLILYQNLALALTCSKDSMYIMMDWKVSPDSDLSAGQNRDVERFVSINEQHSVAFETQASSIVYKGSGLGYLSSRSIGCFSRSILDLTGNSFKLSVRWPTNGTTSTSGSGSVEAFISYDSRVVPLCSLSFGPGLPNINGCLSEKILNLDQIDPEMAAKLRSIKNLETQIQFDLKTYGELRDLLKKLEEKLVELSGKTFDELSEKDFAGYEEEFAQALATLKLGKASLLELEEQVKAAVQKTKDSADKIKKSLESELSKIGVELKDIENLEVPVLGELDLTPPELHNDEDPFDPTHDPYGKLAEAFIREIQSAYPDRRWDILTAVNAWLKRKEALDGTLLERGLVSPKELRAYQASVEKVNQFLYETGCGGNGCFSPDGWFKDSPVPMETRVISAGGLLAGSSTMWRKIGDASLGIKVSRNLEKVGKSLEDVIGRIPMVNGKIFKVSNGAKKIQKAAIDSELARTFENSAYETFETTEKVFLARVFGGKAREEGGFFTSFIPKTQSEAIEKLALDPSWGVTARNMVLVEVQPGVKFHFGKVAPQANLKGGAEQILLDVPAKFNDNKLLRKEYIESLFHSGKIKRVSDILELGE